MAEQQVGEAVRGAVSTFLRQSQLPSTRGHLITVLHSDHPPNEQQPAGLRDVQENDLDGFLAPLQNQIVRFRNDVGTLPGNPFWYAVRQPQEPADTFDQVYHRNANGVLYLR